MKNITALLLSFLVLNACTSLESAIDSVEPFSTSTGYIYFASLVEINSNFSSLLYDKTKAEYDDYKAKYFAKIPLGGKYYVIPAKIESNREYTYSAEFTRAMKNFIRFNSIGKIVKSPDKADYIVSINIKNSITKNFGTNYSKVKIIYFTKDDTPIFYTRVKSVSEYDSNFFNHPSKKAKPVDYLAVKGFERLLNKSFEDLYISPVTKEGA